MKFKTALLLIWSLFLLYSPVTVLGQFSSAERIASIPPPEVFGTRASDGSRAVTVKDSLLFITNYWNGVQIYNISQISNPREVAFFPVNSQAFSTFWDEHYAYVVNHEAGIPVLALDRLPSVEPVAVIKTPAPVYSAVRRGDLLFAALGDRGFCIMDISNLQDPRTLSLEVPGDWIQSLAVEGNLLYLAAKRGGLIIYEISNPELPRKIFQYRTGYNLAYLQVADSLAYLADGGGGLLIMRLTKDGFPEELSRLPLQGYAIHLHKQGNYVYLANRDVGLHIINVSHPEHPVLESTYLTDSEAYGVMKKDVYVFLAANTETLILRHNQAPRLERIEQLVLRENEPFQYRLQVYDPDGDALVVEASPLPEGAEFDARQSIFRWTPDYEQSGTYQVVFRATEQTESQLSVADTVTLVVEHVNRPPDLPPLAPVTVQENQPLVLSLQPGSDPDREDAHRLRYRAENLPEGATFDPDSLIFRWTPSFEQSGLYVIDFVLEDGAGGVDREPLTIRVEHVDRPPVLEPIADLTLKEGQPFEMPIQGYDPDREDSARVRIWMENLPPGAQFDSTTKVFRWTPDYEAAGVYPGVRAIIRSGDKSDTVQFTITVEHVNRPPVLAEIPPYTVKENEWLQFVVQASDPDREDSARLVYAAHNLPPGATFDPDSQRFRWRPTFEQAGVYSNVQFVVTDPGGLSDEKSTTITVENVNRAPQLTVQGPLKGRENELLEFPLQATDPDSEDQGKLQFSAGNLPAGATLEPGGLFRWTPGFDQAGRYQIPIRVSDGELSDSALLVVEIENVNRPPTLAIQESWQVREGDTLEIAIPVTDPDPEDSLNLALQIENLPRGATYQPAQAMLFWRPDYTQSGSYTLTLVASDGKSEVRKDLTVDVLNVNRPPQIAAPDSVQGKEGELMEFTLQLSDPDAEDAGQLQVRVEGIPAGASFDTESGTFRWTPTLEQAGEYLVRFQVTDPHGAMASKEVRVRVQDVPEL